MRVNNQCFYNPVLLSRPDDNLRNRTEMCCLHNHLECQTVLNSLISENLPSC